MTGNKEELASDTSDVRTSIMSHINNKKETVYTVEISAPNKFYTTGKNNYHGSKYAISAKTEKIPSTHNIDDVFTSTSSTYNKTTKEITYTVHVSIPKKHKTNYQVENIKRPDAYDTLQHILKNINE